MQDVRLSPQQLPLSMPVTFVMYGTTSTAALALLLFRPNYYFQHRLHIFLAMRLLRLVVQCLTLLTPSAVAPLALALVARLQDFPQKATAMLLIQPTVYYLQPALSLLPWKYVLFIQLASTAAMLHWLWLLPCFLQAVPQQLGAYPWEPAAGLLCTRLQSYAALLRESAGGSLSDVSHNACDGMVGLQALQVFVVFVVLCVLPVLATYELERWMSHRCSLDSPAASSSIASYAGGNVSSGLTSGSRPTSSIVASSLRSNPRAARAATTGRTLSASDLIRLVDAGAEAGHPFGHACLLAFFLLLVLPVLWLVSELVAQVFAATRDCPALLPLATAAVV